MVRRIEMEVKEKMDEKRIENVKIKIRRSIIR